MLEHLRMLPGSMDEILEDLRCKRTDGKHWRCSALSMQDKTVCEKHYTQAKKRAVNSSVRATQKRGSLDDADIYLEGKQNDTEVSTRSLSPMNAGGLKYKEKFGSSRPSYVNSPEMRGAIGGDINGVLSNFNKEGHGEMQGHEELLGPVNDSYCVSKEVNSLGGGSNGNCKGKRCE